MTTQGIKFGKFTYMLAPIEDMTGAAFRNICHKYGADLTFTVMTRAEGLAKNNKATWSRLDFNDGTPTIIQLLGAKEVYFKKFLKMFKPEEHKGFLGFNLNIGCPSPDIIKLGQGCAMVKRIAKTKKIVEIIKDAGYPVSIKMRLGLNKFEKEKKAYLNLINAVDADFFVVHARYGTQTYAEPADFSVYRDCAETGKIIVANGDIKTKENIKFLEGIGVKGAMIGRAAILNPAVFNEFRGIKTDISSKKILEEYLNLSEKYNEPFKYRKNVIKRIIPTKE